MTESTTIKPQSPVGAVQSVISEQKHSIGWVTFLLAWVAGFCDTATFISGDAIFSAHVTGNFIVFAAQIVSGSGHPASWIKLLTFPVFVIAVITGGWMVSKTRSRYTILLVEGIILVCCGVLAHVLFNRAGGEFTVYFIVMLTVFAMGLQNAFGKLFAKETYGPTTMMTGNVTQIALDLGGILRPGTVNAGESLKNFRKQLITIGGFLAGCVAGALFARWWGLVVIVMPGIAMVLCYIMGEAAKNKGRA